MGKFTVVIEPIYATPKNFPVNILKNVSRKLEEHLIRDVGPMLRADMEKTVANWKTAPSFIQKVSRPYGTRLQLEVFPVGRGTLKWKRISMGTGPRTIRAKKPTGMRFQREYTPKTTPAGKYGGPGKKFGAWVITNRVKHTIKPRKFPVLIMKKRENKIRKDIRSTVKKASRKGIF